MSRSKQEIREEVWQTLENSAARRFPGARGRIPNFVGAERAADRLCELDVWKRAKVLKCNPDSPQRPVRLRALKEGKIVYMAVPRLRELECFIELDPTRLRQNITNANVIDQVGATSPRWQGVASANLDRNAWVATLLYRYRHGYNDAIVLPDGTPHHVAAYQIWDAHAIFTVARNFKLMLGVENLLDAAPPLSSVDTTKGYDPSYADPRGRRWTVGLRASWT